MKCAYCLLPTEDGRSHSSSLTCIARLREALDAALAQARGPLAAQLDPNAVEILLRYLAERFPCNPIGSPCVRCAVRGIDRLIEERDAALEELESRPVAAPAVPDGATRQEKVAAAYRDAGWTVERHEGGVTFSKASTVPPADEEKRPADWLEERRRKVMGTR